MQTTSVALGGGAVFAGASLIFAALTAYRRRRRRRERVRRMVTHMAMATTSGDEGRPLPALPERWSRGRVEAWLLRQLDGLADRLAAKEAQVTEERQLRVAAFDSLRHADRLVAVGKLAAGIAHECGTVLNVIDGRAQMISAGEARGDEAVECAAIISEQTGRIASLLRRQLDYARKSTTGEVASSAAPIGKAVRRVAEMLSPLAKRRGVSVELAGDLDSPAPYPIEAVQHILTNLMVNGIQAMPNGGELRVSLTEGAAPSFPEEPSARGGRWLCLAVADQGTGICPAIKERIFRPFVSTKGTGEGTGLGLWLMRDMVEQLGGRVEVDSAPGAGSHFRVLLPMPRASSGGHPSTTAAKQRVGSPIHGASASGESLAPP